MDLCFELVAQIMERIGGAVSAVDETHCPSQLLIFTGAISGREPVLAAR
jgi:hypothetical protein